jgi:hypothetical protein
MIPLQSLTISLNLVLKILKKDFTIFNSKTAPEKEILLGGDISP